MRTEFRQGRSITEPKAYAARIHLGQEVADVLRKNIVQAVKVEPETDLRDKDVFESKDARWSTSSSFAAELSPYNNVWCCYDRIEVH